jgi:hypothetical protein
MVIDARFMDSAVLMWGESPSRGFEKGREGGNLA